MSVATPAPDAVIAPAAPAIPAAVSAPAVAPAQDTASLPQAEAHQAHAKHPHPATLAKSDDTRSLNQLQIDKLTSDYTRPM
jgi:hypothetical protein